MLDASTTWSITSSSLASVTTRGTSLASLLLPHFPVAIHIQSSGGSFSYESTKVPISFEVKTKVLQQPIKPLMTWSFMLCAPSLQFPSLQLAQLHQLSHCSMKTLYRLWLLPTMFLPWCIGYHASLFLSPSLLLFRDIMETLEELGCYGPQITLTLSSFSSLIHFSATPFCLTIDWLPKQWSKPAMDWNHMKLPLFIIPISGDQMPSSGLLRNQ